MTGGVGATRAALLVVGVLVGMYGAVRLLALGWSNLWATIPWLVGVVIAHDALLALVVLLAGVAAARTLPRWSRGAALLVLVVGGSATLVAVPALGRFGARADNPTLLDRPYLAGWLAVTGLVLVAAALLAIRDRREGAPRG
jgi:hypothetical protein